MMVGRALSVVLVACACSLPFGATAAAQLPKPPSKSIILGKSIGGVRPGITLAVAQSRWGPAA